jgi:hypothetical protein
MNAKAVVEVVQRGHAWRTGVERNDTKGMTKRGGEGRKIGDRRVRMSKLQVVYASALSARRRMRSRKRQKRKGLKRRKKRKRQKRKG